VTSRTQPLAMPAACRCGTGLASTRSWLKPYRTTHPRSTPTPPRTQPPTPQNPSPHQHPQTHPNPTFHATGACFAIDIESHGKLKLVQLLLDQNLSDCCQDAGMAITRTLGNPYQGDGSGNQPRQIYSPSDLQCLQVIVVDEIGTQSEAQTITNNKQKATESNKEETRLGHYLQ
jgi:hypothetical protein